MEAEELLDRYQRGERHFQSVDLGGANLSGVNLKQIDLSGADLGGANLSWAVLTEAQLTGANLTRADLQNALLTSAHLDRAKLNGANFSRADLRFASVQNARLNWAILEGIQAHRINLTASRLDRAKLKGAILDKAELGFAQLPEADLSKTNWVAANLREANLREANLREANLREANLTAANLTEADLGGAMLRSAVLVEADLHRSRLGGADLTRATLDRADLSRADLADAYLLKASFRQTDLLRANLQGVYLLWGNFVGANLQGADLRRADLSGAYLQESSLAAADLREALLVDAHLIRTTLEGANLTGCCICNWRPREVDLSGVVCEYLFAGFDFATKQPSDRTSAVEALGLEATSDGRTLLTVEFFEAIDWEALVYAVAAVEGESRDLTLTIWGFETLPDRGRLQLQANHWVNAEWVGDQILGRYPEMVARVGENRAAIAQLLGLHDLSDSAGDPSRSPHLELSQLSERQKNLYWEISRQIQSILNSQSPSEFVDPVQRLLSYLEKQGISTREIRHRAIVEQIVGRAKREPKFREQLRDWEKQTGIAGNRSPMQQLLRFAIALLSTES
ncbi:pentapeptide repeat-containing protein [Lyngbya sp. CCY1209]|uniref:pentapeptide repeat-containing protein n=1 Tax=Lyngbya sp. CCY1209 TaxID=2886103 RepID=UPI002D20D713|nr:pentapeptide repeat-containing protein [Lyngbya sp. CCY1209]MEB3886787.1 pentapeptide repeat-containing protein [Lyngbya sp. CCY1209]